MAEKRDAPKPLHWRLKTTFCLDAALLVSVCALQTVPFTGLVIHEWLGLAVSAMTLAHLLFSWSWIASISRRLFTAESTRGRINYLLNMALFAAVTAAIFSGILISQKAIPALTGANVPPEMNWRWDTLHHEFSTFVIVLSGLHLAMNWDWILAAVEKLLGRIREGAL